MKLQLNLEIPSNINAGELMRALQEVISSREGITLTTPRRQHFDVDLVYARRTDTAAPPVTRANAGRGVPT